MAALRRLMEDAVPRAVYDEQVLKEGGGEDSAIVGAWIEGSGRLLTPPPPLPTLCPGRREHTRF